MSGKKDAYWFPDKTVKEGDLIVLYTKTGKSSSKPLTDGRTSYFYYWHLKEAVWQEEKNNLAVIGRFNGWTAVSPASL